MRLCWVVVFAVLAVCASLPIRKKFHHFMFVHSWQATECMKWMTSGKNRKCIIGAAIGWTIHGLWPSLDKQLGPYDCDKNDRFNPNALRSLLPELEVKWPTVKDEHIQRDEYSFLRYQWSRHGTCARQLPTLNTQKIYFGKGWYVSYYSRDRLTFGGITWHESAKKINYFKFFLSVGVV